MRIARRRKKKNDNSNGKTREINEGAEFQGIYRPLRCRKLLLFLRNDQVVQNECPLTSIRHRFHEMNIQGKVQPSENYKPNTYTLVFSSYQQAEEVLLRSKEIGYNIVKKWPPRPNSKRLLKYIALANLDILSGKAMSGEFKGVLEKGTTVTVNQIKGRRARLCEEKEDGEIINIGWVSFHQGGETLLAQLGDF